MQLQTPVLNDPVLANDWHVVAKSQDLSDKQIISARILGEDVVLWKVDGQIMAWRDLCLHRGSKLSLGKIVARELVCSYHGWSYDTSGSCVHIPAHPEQLPPSKAQVEKYQVVEKYGLIWVCMGTHANQIGSFPEWQDNSYRKIHCGPYLSKASAPRLVENFLDVAHLPFVHEGLLGDREHAEINDYEVNVDSNGITASNIRLWQPDPDGTGIGAPVVYTYKVLRPLTAYLTKVSFSQGFSIFMSVTPTDSSTSSMWMIIAMNYGAHVDDRTVREFEDKVVMQDMRVVESQRPELLPLDLQAELHLRSDRTAIAYRKWLQKLGLTFGTA